MLLDWFFFDKVVALYFYVVRMPDSDIIGKKFNRLTPIREAERRNHNRAFLCKCDCGNEKVIRLDHLLRFESKSCGCLLVEFSQTSNLQLGKSNTPEHKIWMGIKKRCYNERDHNFIKYGGRGIKVCDRWLNDFPAFFQDMGPKPSPDQSIERIDNNGHYEPGNCRWATRKEQGRNKRNNRLVTLNGKTQCLSAWYEELGVSVGLVDQRRKRGWPIEKALALPPLSPGERNVSSQPSLPFRETA